MQKLATLRAASTLLTLVVLLLSASEGVLGRVKHYKWQVDYRFWSPDCVEKLIISINGQYPGPTIRAREGDTIVVELENLMPTEAVLIHWHGIRQKGTPWYDGAGGVSQCAVSPGETFVYKFVVDKAGTYFYHGHLGLQRSAGFYGSLIVDLPKGKKEPFHYDGELSVVLNDWWHRSAYEQGLGLFSNPFRWVGEPQSLLMDGRGRYNCSLVDGSEVAKAAGNSPACNASNEQCAPLVLRVQAGKTYRLRIASVASLSSLNFQIEGHSMRVVEADGYYVEEVELRNLDVYSGETYSVLVKAFDEAPSGQKSFWAVSHVRGRLPKTPPGLAVVAYVPDANDESKPPLPTTSPPPSPAPWNDTAFSLAQSRLFVARQGVPVPPPSSDQQVILLNTQNRIDGVIKWAINNYSLIFPATPFLPVLKYSLKNSLDSTPPPTTYPYHSYDIWAPPRNPNAQCGSRLYKFPLNSTVDFILQNANTLTPNNSEVHPWHIHGHEFWVLGYGMGAFDPARDPQSFNLNNPPLRNTVPLYPYGWTAVRFVADNPGVWPFHCHLESHFHMGMGILFAQGIEHLGRPPRSTLGCGFTKRWLP